MPRPKGLTIIGILFLCGGALAAYQAIQSLFSSKGDLNLAFLMFPVGIGLLRGKSSSRFWAKGWIGFFVLILSAALLAYPFFSESYHVRFMSTEIHGLARHTVAVVIPVLLILPGVIAWKYLCRRELDSFFGDPNSDVPSEKEKGGH